MAISTTITETKDTDLSWSYCHCKDAQFRNRIILGQLITMYVMSVFQLMDWNILVSYIDFQI